MMLKAQVAIVCRFLFGLPERTDRLWFYKPAPVFVKRGQQSKSAGCTAEEITIA
jgi:hypothetical protein